MQNLILNVLELVETDVPEHRSYKQGVHDLVSFALGFAARDQPAQAYAYLERAACNIPAGVTIPGRRDSLGRAFCAALERCKELAHEARTAPIRADLRARKDLSERLAGVVSTQDTATQSSTCDLCGASGCEEPRATLDLDLEAVTCTHCRFSDALQYCWTCGRSEHPESAAQVVASGIDRRGYEHQCAPCYRDSLAEDEIDVILFASSPAVLRAAKERDDYSALLELVRSLRQEASEAGCDLDTASGREAVRWARGGAL
jgi:hypothetical protein